MFVVFFGELCNFLVPNYSDPYRKKNVNRMEMDGILQEKYKIKPPSILSMFQPYYLRSADPYLRASSLKLKCELPTFLFLEKGQLDSASEVQSFSLQEPNIHVRVIYFMFQHSWFVFFFFVDSNIIPTFNPNLALPGRLETSGILGDVEIGL